MEENNLDLSVLFGQTLTSIGFDIICRDLDRLIFGFEEHVLSVSCDLKTASILLSISSKNSSKRTKSKPTYLDKYLGKRLIFIWKCIDSFQSLDALMFAFSDQYPNIAIVTSSSDLEILEMDRIDIQNAL